jgi:hypothetical protein
MGWNRKRLSDRCTGFGWQYLVRMRGFLVKGRLVCKQMLENNGRRSRGPVLVAASENTVRGATEHITAKTQRVAALKVGECVSREANGPRRRRGLVTLYGLLRRGHERMSQGRDIIRMTRGKRTMEGAEESMEGATENGAVRAEGRCFNFLLTVRATSFSWAF